MHLVNDLDPGATDLDTIAVLRPLDVRLPRVRDVLGLSQSAVPMQRMGVGQSDDEHQGLQQLWGERGSSQTEGGSDSGIPTKYVPK